ncbi:helix-turn-helix domain-containing protein [Embleya sp. NPDC001921]
MSLYRLDAAALFARLDAKRKPLGWSWRTVGTRLDVSPSTFSRMQAGHAPSAAALVTCLVWLDLDTDIVHLLAPGEADPT